MNDLSRLPERIGTASLGRLRLRVRSVLRSFGGVSEAGQGAAGEDAGRDSPVRPSPWPGKNYGVRQPDPKEIPLSWAEVKHGRVHGLFGDTQGEGVKA